MFAWILLKMATFCGNNCKNVGIMDEHQVWRLTGNRVACGSSPGGGRIFFLSLAY